MIRSTKALRPIIRSRLTASQRGFHISRPVRQAPAGGTPKPGTPNADAQRNKYIMYGAGALGLGAVFYYMTAKPEQKNVPKSTS